MDEFLFYVLNDKPPNDQSAAPPEDESLRAVLWRPGLLRIKPRHVPGRAVNAYWLFHVLRVFKNRDYTFLLLFRDDELVHYAAAYPGYFRFPFMAKRDLQIGYVWTDPSCRGQSLAVRGVHLLVDVLGAKGRRFWYVVNKSNASSIRVAQKAGFTRVGIGHAQRTWWLAGGSVYCLAYDRGTLKSNVAA